MRRWNRCCGGLAIAAALNLASGCTDKPGGDDKKPPAATGQLDDEAPKAREPGDGSPSADSADNVVPVPIEPAPPPEPVMPEVKLSAAHAATCLLKVGDTMPDAKLQDLDDHEHAISDLLGDKATVVMFWTASRPYAVEELADLQLQAAEPYSERGVRVAAIHVGLSEAARQTGDDAGAKFPILIDPESAYFAKVATDGLPRVYLLDPNGKILWFDIECSASTHRQLEQALAVVLGKEGSSPAVP